MIKVYNENIGMNNQNIFKIMEVIDTDEFRDLINDFDESTLVADICDAINNATGSARVCVANINGKKLAVEINGKRIFIKDKESYDLEHPEKVNLNQSMKIQDFIQTKCSLEWIDEPRSILPK